MENLQRIPGKDLATSLPKPSRAARRWTLMIVGEHGWVFSLKRFKGLVYLWIFLLVVSILISTGLYYLYRETISKNERLNLSVEAARKHVIAMRHEKDILMARLVVAETQLERMQPSPEKPIQQVSDSADSKRIERDNRDSPLAALPQNQKTEQPDEIKTDGTEVPEKTDQASQSKGSHSESVPVAVDVENLEVEYDIGKQMIRAQFKLLNVLDQSDPIAGYTAIVLKQDESDPKHWLTLPKLVLKSGKPAGNKRGQYFSIYRFKTVTFTAIYRMDPVTYHLATVFVFDSNKSPLYEKSFSIRIKKVESAVDGQ